MSLIAHPDSGLLLVGSPNEGGTGLLAVSLLCCCDENSGSDTVTSTCCPGREWPTNLHVTITNKSQDCVDCFPDDFIVFRLPTPTLSYRSDLVIDCSGGTTDYVTLDCRSPGASAEDSPTGLHISFTCLVATITFVSESCEDPWSVVWDVTVAAGPTQPDTCCPTDGGSFRITFTE